MPHEKTHYSFPIGSNKPDLRCFQVETVLFTGMIDGLIDYPTVVRILFIFAGFIRVRYTHMNQKITKLALSICTILRKTWTF